MTNLVGRLTDSEIVKERKLRGCISLRVALLHHRRHRRRRPPPLTI
jgi:hypothetical protein